MEVVKLQLGYGIYSLLTALDCYDTISDLFTLMGCMNLLRLHIEKRDCDIHALDYHGKDLPHLTTRGSYV